jgi:tetratricopeptide (TPR) repeat protein
VDYLRTTSTDRLLLTGLLAAVFFFCLTPVHNGNIFWHLRNGEDILDTGSIRLSDPFTHTMYGEYWVQQEWLAEVFFAAAWRAGGAAGLIFLKGLVVTASVLLAALAARRRGASAGAIVLVAVLWFSISHARWIVRPHIFTLLFFSLYLFLLSGKRRRTLTGNLILFLPLQILWVNIHAGFVMGPFLLFLPVLDRLGEGNRCEAWKALLLPFCALAVSVVHPNGFRSLEYLPSFLSQPLFRESIREWWSPFDPRYQPGLRLSKTAFMLMIALALTVTVVFVCRKRARLSDIVALAALGIASVFAARNIELLSLAAVAWISPLPRKRPRAWIPAALIGCAFAVAILYGIPREVGPPKRFGLDVDWEIYPVELADFIEQNPALMQATVFNTNEISGYLEYRFGESLPLYMDGRCLLYPERFFEEYLLLAKADSTRALEQLRIHQNRGTALALFDWPDPGMSSAWLLARLPGWTPIFWDDLTIAYARKDMLDSAGLAHLAMDNVDPLDSRALLSWPLYRIPPSWIPELERAAAYPLDLGLAGVLVCAVHLQRGDLEGALLSARSLWNDSLRISMLMVLEGGDPESDQPEQLTVIRTWSLVRMGRLEEALDLASSLGDPVLMDAITIWMAFIRGNPLPLSSCTAMPFIPGEMIDSGHDTGFDSPTGKLLLASAAMTSGQLERAIVILDEVLTCGDSLSPWMLGTAALILATSGDDSTAVILADRALTLSANPYTLEARGRVEWMAGRYESASFFFDGLLDISPGYALGRMFYADCIWRLGNVNGALEQYRQLAASGESLPPEAASRIKLMEMLLEGSGGM